MNISNSLPREVRRLVDDMLNGNLSESGLQQLEECLAGNVEMQQKYRNYCQLHLNLEMETRSQRALELSVESIIESDRKCLATASNASVRPTKRLSGDLSWMTWFGLAGCMLLAATVATLVAHQLGIAERQATQVRAGSETLDLDVITVRLATAESRVLPIGEFGSVSIQGPAHFELLGTHRARLKHGRIKVRINDERGHGFVVETPRGLVTDLGTEFGVDVAGDANTGVVVFEGMVDLAVPSEKDRDVLRVERLIQGEGMAVQPAGQLDRIMSIVTGNVSTFQQQGEWRLGAKVPLIADVYDNIRSTGFKKFYEIVPGGLQEDVLAYADRPRHEWNGVDELGIPEYLLGADYIKPFNSDKLRDDVQITVAVARPARLFVFVDDRVEPPSWLPESFEKSGDRIGLDAGTYMEGDEEISFLRAKGPGKSLDATFSIWERVVEQPGVVRLGPNLGGSYLTAMYGIAAIPLEKADSER